MSTTTIERPLQSDEDIIAAFHEQLNNEQVTAEFTGQSESVETQEPLTRMQRIRNKLGYYSARMTVAAMNFQNRLAGKAAERADDSQEYHESVKPETKRNLGRFAFIATGALAVGSLAMAYASAKSGADSPHDLLYSHAVEQRHIVAGRTDGTGVGYANAIRGFGEPGNESLIQYPAQIAPVPGDTVTFDESSRIAADGTYNSVKASNGGHVYVHSEGSQGGLMGLNRLAAEQGRAGQLPLNTELTMTGSPQYANSGFFNDPLTKVAQPVLKAFGISAEAEPIPAGATAYGKPGDFWANSGDRNIFAKIDQGIGTWAGNDHGYTAADLNDTSRQTSFVGEDGVRYVTIHEPAGGIESPGLRVAQSRGMLVTEQADDFVSAIAPKGEIGKPAPEVNINEVISTGTALIEDTAARNGMPIDIPDMPSMPAPSAPDMSPAPAPAPMPVPEVMQQFVTPEIQQAIEQFTVPAMTAPLEQAVSDAIANNPFAQFGIK